MLSPADMIVIGAVALLFFGPDQLPKVARNAGRVIRDVQATSQSFIREMERAADEPDHATPRSPWTSPAAAEHNAEPAPGPAPFAAEAELSTPHYEAEPFVAEEPGISESAAGRPSSSVRGASGGEPRS